MMNMNSGYTGYSMSNRACEAYNNGEKPYSKWSKSDIISEIEEYAKNNDILFTMSVLKKAPKQAIIDLVLRRSSWHHTSSFCNATDFYSIDFDIVDMLTDDMITKAAGEYKNVKKTVKKYDIIKYKGNIAYLEWGGTRKHPTASKHTLNDVYIEEKGCFYIVTDENGNQLLKKKIGSNGTYVTKV